MNYKMKWAGLIAITALAPSLVLAQGSGKKTATRAGAKPTEMKMSGMLSGDVKGGKFVLANKEGKVNVDAGNLKALDKSGKSFDLAKLGGGSNLTVWGMKEGMTLKANKIQVNFSRSAEFLAAHPEYAKGVKSPRDVATGQVSGKGKGVVSPRDPASGQATGKRKGKKPTPPPTKSGG